MKPQSHRIKEAQTIAADMHKPKRQFSRDNYLEQTEFKTMKERLKV